MRGALTPSLLALIALSCAGGAPHEGGGERAPRFAYVLNETDETVTIHTVEPPGRLRFVGYAPTRPFPRAIASDPSGSWVFVGTAGTPALSPPPYLVPLLVSYRVDSATGALRETGIVQIGRDVLSLGFSPNWRSSEAEPPQPCLIVRSYGAVELFRFDESSGELSPIGDSHSLGSGLSWAAIHPSGRFLLAIDWRSSSIFTLSPDGARISEVGTQIGSHSAALDPTGERLYVGHSDANSLSRYRVDPATGALHREGEEVLLPQISLHGLAMHPSGRLLVTSHRRSQMLSVFRIDPSTGEPAAISSAPLSREFPSSITIDATGRYLLATHAGEGALSFFVVDEASGELRPVKVDFTARGAAIGAAFVSGPAPSGFRSLFPWWARPRPSAQPAAMTL